MKVSSFIISFVIIILIGCMHRHYVSIDPYVPVTPHTIKEPRSIGLMVVNARSSNNISQRSGLGLSFYSPMFTVQAESDLTDIMRQKISEGLIQIGFKPKRIEKIPNKTFRVEIIKLKSKYKENLLAIDVKVQAAFRAYCINEVNSYSKTYNYEKQLNSTPASTFPNENLINGTLSGTLKKMFEDENLIACLAR